MLLVEELAARGWPAAEAAPARRLAAAPHAVADAAALELGAAARRRPAATRRSWRSSTRAAVAARSCRSRPPRSAPASTPSSAAGAGRARGRPTSSWPTRRGARAHGAGRRWRSRTRPNADWVAAWAACEERPDADEHAREVLARIEPATAYARAAERPRRRAGGVRARLGGAVLRGHGRGRARGAASRGTRGPRPDALGRRARRAADLPTGRERQRAGARPLRARGLRALARLSLPGSPEMGRGAC